MGFLVLFKFAVKCFDILAWPLFALVYPLWASIQAIEADDSSLSECRKLVAYWVLFSIIFLFEQAFEKLLQWLPFWLYIKLIITCWLVTSNFGGAFYAYKHLVCPCLSIDINALINNFKALADFSSKSSNFEDEVKRYVKENGSQFPEELVASEVKGKEPDVVQNDVKTVQVKEQIKDVAAREPKKFVHDFVQEILTCESVSESDNHSSQDSNTITEDKSVDEILERIELLAEESFPLMSKSKKKLKKLAEINEPKCRESDTEQKDVKTVELTKSEEVAVVKQQVSLTETDKSNLAPEEINEISQKVEEAGGESSEIQVSNQVQEWTCALCQVTTQSEITRNSHLQGRRHIEACYKLQAENQLSETKEEEGASLFRQRKKHLKLQAGIRKKHVEYKEPLWWCKICHIGCSSVDTMDSHLYGKKHLAALTRESNAPAAAMSKVL